MSPELEKAARAAFDFDWGEHGSDAEFEQSRDYWIKSTQAVLRSLMEPSEGTVEAGVSAGLWDAWAWTEGRVHGEARAVWQAILRHVVGDE